MVRERCSASEQLLSLSVLCTTNHRHMLILGELMLVLVVMVSPPIRDIVLLCQLYNRHTFMPRISDSIGLHCGSAWSELLECNDSAIGDRRGTVWGRLGRREYEPPISSKWCCSQGASLVVHRPQGDAQPSHAQATVCGWPEARYRCVGKP